MRTLSHLTTKKKKIRYLLQSPCSVCHPFCRSYQHYEHFCSPRFTLVLLLLLFWGTYILIMFSCKLTNDEKLNTRSAQHNWETSVIKLPKSNSNLRYHCPKKRFTRKQTIFSSRIIFVVVVVVFFFSFGIFCLQYSLPSLMLVILVLLMNHNMFISFCVI